MFLASFNSISNNILLDDIDDGRGTPDPEFECDSEKQHIPDETLWKMFGTGVSFRALSDILNLSFSVADVDNRFFTSTSYLFRSYQRMLQAKENKYKAQVREGISYGSLCFDHQATRKITGKYEGNSHRLAIVWYSDKSHNVIGMPEMPDKTAASQTVAITQTCHDFGIECRQIVALTCDNENTNVGTRGGTCLSLQNTLKKALLRLMCRRHIPEIVIKDVYHTLFASDTPNNLFFPMLKDRWSELREANFPFTPFDDIANPSFHLLRDKALDQLRKNVKSKHIRDDYKEVTLLALRFFGEDRLITKGKQVKFRTIINPSNARFMATVIQGMECFLFRNHFEWVDQMKHNLKRFAMFCALMYVRYWNESSILFDAPMNDLSFLQDLQTYQLIDEEVAAVAMSALNRHLYYMSEELSPLSLFSDKASIQQKNLIAQKLSLIQNEVMPLRRRHERSNQIAYSDGIGDRNHDWNSKCIADLIGDRSQYFFDIMNLPRNFLRLDASEWNRNPDYINAKKIAENALICINDTSERVISNCKSKFNKQRCRKESSFRQNMLNLHSNLKE